ncbi:MAG: hypothetical protein WCH13_05665, partial [Deltaproteobacteria bacterium]
MDEVRARDLDRAGPGIGGFERITVATVTFAAVAFAVAVAATGAPEARAVAVAAVPSAIGSPRSATVTVVPILVAIVSGVLPIEVEFGRVLLFVAFAVAVEIVLLAVVPDLRAILV